MEGELCVGYRLSFFPRSWLDWVEPFHWSTIKNNTTLGSFAYALVDDRHQLIAMCYCDDETVKPPELYQAIALYEAWEDRKEKQHDATKSL